MSRTESRPLICHVVHRFDVGGLENGIVNLINGMPEDGWRHAVVALTECTDFVKRIERSDVRCVGLNKRAGKDLGAYVRLYRLFRELRPDIVHSRNIGTMDCHAVAWAAGVPGHVHGEHGWDVGDFSGASSRYRLLRRTMAPLVHRFVALSQELEQWLLREVGIMPSKVVRICNGVDIERFRPVGRVTDHRCPLTFGTVTRFSEVKDPMNTLEAFLSIRPLSAQLGRPVKLIMVGDGPLLETAVGRACAAGAREDVCFAGRCHDVWKWLARMDVFVLGSRREGVSNTILEAMSSGLPVIATNTGGNVELVEHDSTGLLVTPESSADLAQALMMYVRDPQSARRHGANSRSRVLERYSIERMISDYAGLYRSLPMRAEA